MKNVVVTGCDKNTEWQLPWFVRNFRRYNPTQKLAIADFGMSPSYRTYVDRAFDTFEVKQNYSWFKKPTAIIKATELADKVLWLDTDCEVRGPLEGVWGLFAKTKLNMVADRPWTSRRPNLGRWYNSGVVGVTGCPQILVDWEQQCGHGGEGDQTTLHMMMNGDEVKKAMKINPLPHEYNTLRLDLLDGTAPPNPIVMHWTGQKGNDEIKRQMNQFREVRITGEWLESIKL